MEAKDVEHYESIIEQMKAVQADQEARIEKLQKELEAQAEANNAEMQTQMDEMNQQRKSAKNDSKKNYWAMALQLKCKNMMSEKIRQQMEEL